MEDLALLLENATPFRLHDATTHIDRAPSPVLAQGWRTHQDKDDQDKD